MSISSGIVFGLAFTVFSLFYLSNSIVIAQPVKKSFGYYANVVMKVAFMQFGIFLVPTVLSLCLNLLQDLSPSYPTALASLDSLVGYSWLIYYIYISIFATILIFEGIHYMLNRGDN